MFEKFYWLSSFVYSCLIKGSSFIRSITHLNWTPKKKNPIFSL